MSEIMQALYRGDDETARRLAETAELDVFEAASLGLGERLGELLAADPGWRRLVRRTTSPRSTTPPSSTGPRRLGCSSSTERT
jgi:hypothetical protein